MAQPGESDYDCNDRVGGEKKYSHSLEKRKKEEEKRENLLLVTTKPQQNVGRKKEMLIFIYLDLFNNSRFFL
jgi:hypothetical protein